MNDQRRSPYYRDDVAPGDRVRLLVDERLFGDVVARAGEVATVVRLGGSHHVENGGGFDVELAFDDGRRFPTFAEGYAKDDAGDFIIRPNVLPYLAVRNTALELVGVPVHVEVTERGRKMIERQAREATTPTGLPAPVSTAWIDVMGVTPTYIEAIHDGDMRRVYVTPATLETMIESFRESGLFDEEATEGTIAAMRAAPRVGDLVDVTDLGGGWVQWAEMRNDGLDV